MQCGWLNGAFPLISVVALRWWWQWWWRWWWRWWRQSLPTFTTRVHACIFHRPFECDDVTRRAHVRPKGRVADHSIERPLLGRFGLLSKRDEAAHQRPRADSREEGGLLMLTPTLLLSSLHTSLRSPVHSSSNCRHLSLSPAQCCAGSCITRRCPPPQAREGQS